MTLTRTQISLSDADRRALEAAHLRTGQSMSSLIRDAIRLAYGEPSPSERVESALEATFGVLLAQRAGEESVDSVRSGARLSGS